MTLDEANWLLAREAEIAEGFRFPAPSLGGKACFRVAPSGTRPGTWDVELAAQELERAASELANADEVLSAMRGEFARQGREMPSAFLPQAEFDLLGMGMALALLDLCGMSQDRLAEAADIAAGRRRQGMSDPWIRGRMGVKLMAVGTGVDAAVPALVPAHVAFDDDDMPDVTHGDECRRERAEEFLLRTGTAHGEVEDMFSVRLASLADLMERRLARMDGEGGHHLRVADRTSAEVLRQNGWSDDELRARFGYLPAPYSPRGDGEQPAEANPPGAPLQAACDAMLAGDLVDMRGMTAKERVAMIQALAGRNRISPCADGAATLVGHHAGGGRP